MNIRETIQDMCMVTKVAFAFEFVTATCRLFEEASRKGSLVDGLRFFFHFH